MFKLYLNLHFLSYLARGQTLHLRRMSSTGTNLPLSSAIHGCASDSSGHQPSAEGPERDMAGGAAGVHQRAERDASQ